MSGPGEYEPPRIWDLVKVSDAARALFDNRLGWDEGRQPHAPRELWANLGAALYGEDDRRVKELRDKRR